MIVNLVYVWVKEKYLEEFLRATVENHQNTIKEPGNLRFDVLRDSENPAKFVLYEAFKDDQAAADHKATPHYAKWRDTVADWMEEPRKGIKHSVIAPLREIQWLTATT